MTSPTSDRRQGLVGNTPIKAPVDCATTANIVLSGEQVIDGVQTALSRVLVHVQTDATQNGIYNSSSGSWTRTDDADGNYDLTTGTLVSVTGGIAQALAFYQLTTVKPIVIGTSALNWVQVLASGAFAGSVFATPLREVQMMSAGQTLVVLTTMAYVVGNHSLTVLVDGLVVDEADYTQTSATSITFASAFIGGEQATFITNTFSTFGSGKAQMNQSTTSPTDVGTLVVQRSVEYSGGTPGFVNSAIRADTFVDNVGAAAFEWTIVGAMHNHATGGENVGGYFQGNKYSGAGPTWAAVLEAIDLGTGDPASGLVAVEVDVRGNGTDVNNNRVGIDLIYSRQGLTGVNMETGYGLRFQDAGDHTGAFLRTAIGFGVSSKIGFGIDFSPATITAAAIKMAQGQVIVFDTSVNPPKLTSQGLGLDHLIGTNLTNRLLATGGLQVGATQVVGPRITGWALPTGTLSRATFDQSTVTTAQLAQRVAALITDIYGSGSGHGLIGA